jgi:hypothetical protein
MDLSYRELRPEYAERVWRGQLRKLTRRGVDAVNWRYRPESEPEEFAMVRCYTVGDYRAVLKAITGNWRITRQVPGTGYPRTVYLAPDWDEAT